MERNARMILHPTKRARNAMIAAGGQTARMINPINTNIHPKPILSPPKPYFVRVAHTHLDRSSRYATNTP